MTAGSSDESTCWREHVCIITSGISSSSNTGSIMIASPNDGTKGTSGTIVQSLCTTSPGESGAVMIGRCWRPLMNAAALGSHGGVQHPRWRRGRHREPIVSRSAQYRR